jgi:hypothetical protein
MEIQNLRAVIREDEINEYLTSVVPPDAAVANLRVRLVPEGLMVLGDYSALFMKMSFETLWEVSVAAGVVRSRLAHVKVAGLPATLLRGVLLKVIRDATAQHPGLSVQDDAVRIDINQALQARKVPLSVYPTAVVCGDGHLVLEAGPPLA